MIEKILNGMLSEFKRDIGLARLGDNWGQSKRMWGMSQIEGCVCRVKSGRVVQWKVEWMSLE